MSYAPAGLEGGGMVALLVKLPQFPHFVSIQHVVEREDVVHAWIDDDSSPHRLSLLLFGPVNGVHECMCKGGVCPHRYLKGPV
jgi:hypothetical protein